MCGMKMLSEIATIAPILTAILMAWIAFRQYGINQSQLAISKDKIRLDLYQRRFAVYEATLTFYQALMGSSETLKTESFEKIHRDFIKAFRESQFLFDDGSGIFKLLDELHKESFKIIGFKTHDESKSVPELFTKMYQDSLSALGKLESFITELEKAIGPYLNFRHVLA